MQIIRKDFFANMKKFSVCNHYMILNYCCVNSYLELHDEASVDIDAGLGVVPRPACGIVGEVRAVAATIGGVRGVEDVVDLAEQGDVGDVGFGFVLGFLLHPLAYRHQVTQVDVRGSVGAQSSGIVLRVIEILLADDVGLHRAGEPCGIEGEQRHCRDGRRESDGRLAEEHLFLTQPVVVGIVAGDGFGIVEDLVA